MNFFDKKSLVIIIFLLIITCISIYFFTKDDSNNYLSTNELYITQNTVESSTIIEEIIIHIDGEVLNPGLVYLPVGSRINDAISAAGGTTELANTAKVNLAYELKDGQKIHIPSIYDIEESSYVQNDAGDNIILSDTSSNSSLINLNTATQAELETLPGIGSATASKIIDYRNKNGDFEKIEDIMNVSGIGEAKFNNIKEYICI